MFYTCTLFLYFNVSLFSIQSAMSTSMALQTKFRELKQRFNMVSKLEVDWSKVLWAYAHILYANKLRWNQSRLKQYLTCLRPIRKSLLQVNHEQSWESSILRTKIVELEGKILSALRTITTMFTSILISVSISILPTESFRNGNFGKKFRCFVFSRIKWHDCDGHFDSIS